MKKKNSSKLSLIYYSEHEMGLKLKSKGGASIAARDSEKARALKQSHDCQSFENLSPYSGLSYQHFCPLLYYEYSIVLKAI